MMFAQIIVQITVQITEQENITERLKANEQMEWARRMNNIRNRAEEIIYDDLRTKVRSRFLKGTGNV